MPVAARARRVAAATSFTCTIVPTSSGNMSRVTSIAIARRAPLALPSPAERVNTVACGESTPSVPPDHTKAIFRPTSSAEMPRCFANKVWYDEVA
jgi:hypothetical protein